MESFEFTAMNTQIVLAAEGDSAMLAQAFQHTREYIDRRVAQFTRFAETSELSALNRSGGSWFNASPELFTLVEEAHALYVETGGLFNPAILDALERVGYDASYEVVRERANPYVAPLLAVGDFGAVSFHPALRAIWMPRGVRIDLGGIAKGWIGEHAARVLAEYADICAVNAGGDVFTVGLPRGAEAWEIEIEDPRDPAQTIAVLQAPAGAVATSSINKRKWKQGALERHHLMDPRTALPATSDWLSVTVIAPRATVAEVYAKALLIGGSAQANEIVAKRGEIECIAVGRDGRLWSSEHARELMYAA